MCTDQLQVDQTEVFRIPLAHQTPGERTATSVCSLCWLSFVGLFCVILLFMLLMFTSFSLTVSWHMLTKLWCKLKLNFVIVLFTLRDHWLFFLLLFLLLVPPYSSSSPPFSYASLCILRPLFHISHCDLFSSYWAGFCFATSWGIDNQPQLRLKNSLKLSPWGLCCRVILLVQWVILPAQQPIRCARSALHICREMRGHTWNVNQTMNPIHQ